MEFDNANLVAALRVGIPTVEGLGKRAKAASLNTSVVQVVSNERLVRRKMTEIGWARVSSRQPRMYVAYLNMLVPVLPGSTLRDVVQTAVACAQQLAGICDMCDDEIALVVPCAGATCSMLACIDCLAERNERDRARCVFCHEPFFGLLEHYVQDVLNGTLAANDEPLITREQASQLMAYILNVVRATEFEKAFITVATPGVMAFMEVNADDAPEHIIDTLCQCSSVTVLVRCVGTDGVARVSMYNTNNTGQVTRVPAAEVYAAFGRDYETGERIERPAGEIYV